MYIVNREVRDFLDTKESNRVSILTIKRMDRLVSLIKVYPGNLVFCFKRIAKEFKCAPNAIQQIYYNVCRPHLAPFIRVVTENGSTSGNTKNNLHY